MSRNKKQDAQKKEVSIIRSSTAEYLTFVAAGGDSEASVEMRYENENIWLTQKMMATLYDVTVSAVNQHLKRIFADNELTPEATVKKYLIVQNEGSRQVKRQVDHYSLQAIIAVGFKIENERAIQFRKWANQIVKDYTILGWSMDVERLKSGGSILTDEFFERQLEKIREIRLSERKFYQKITDIYATALDYDSSAIATKRFFTAVQNKMHYAVHGNTAAEVIFDRANHKKENMGLTSWDNAPTGKIHKYDVSIAKNYLSEFELGQMQRIVSAYLDMAEMHAMRKIPMTMADWEKRLTGFLKLWDREILNDAGKVSKELAKAHAESEFEKYRIFQDRLFESDFDRLLKQGKFETIEVEKRPQTYLKTATPFLGLNTLKPRLRVTAETVECPVLGCEHTVKRQRRVFKTIPEFQCPEHNIYISPSTWEYPKETDNLLWIDTDDINLLDDIKTKKRESRMARDNSEDSLTWNIFRYLEKQDIVNTMLSQYQGIKLTDSQIIYWSWSQQEKSDYNLLNKARLEFGETIERGSEPDLIVQTDKVLFFIEAKLTASNNTIPSRGSREKLYCSGADNWYDSVFTQDFDTIARTNKKYELLRFWLLGTWMAKQAGLEFHLVNLVPEWNEKNIETEFKPLIKKTESQMFSRMTWEDIYRFISKNNPPDQSMKTQVMTYMENKTIGYKNGVLTKAFGV